MKKERTDSLEYIAKKHKQEQEEYLKAGVVKRVALYARQSVDKKDSISIDTQLDACRRLLKENEPYKEYTDKGYSGKDTNRPAFQQMLKDLHAGKISKIIVYKIDRCSRSVLDFYQLVHTLDTLGCGFVSVNIHISALHLLLALNAVAVRNRGVGVVSHIVAGVQHLYIGLGNLGLLCEFCLEHILGKRKVAVEKPAYKA